MKVAIVGSSGYIAGYLLKRFAEEKKIERIIKIDQTYDADIFLNLQCPQEFDYSLMDDIDFIIFTAANSGPDKCATDFDFCWNINVTGTSHFIHQVIERKCRVLFLSSDAVFGNIDGCIYDEESPTLAETPYGKMKKAVEDEFIGNPMFKAIRLSYVVSTRDRFVSYCLNCIRNDTVADIFHPFYRNCIVVSDVVDVAVWFAIHWSEYTPTFLNVAGKELVSRLRIADEINRHLNNKLRYTVSVPNDVFFMNRPKITQMRSLYLQRYQILSDDTFTEKFKRELEDISI